MIRRGDAGGGVAVAVAVAVAVVVAVALTANVLRALHKLILAFSSIPPVVPACNAILWLSILLIENLLYCKSLCKISLKFLQTAGATVVL